MAQSTGMSATSAGGTGGHQRAAAVLVVAAIAAMTLAPLAALAAGESESEPRRGQSSTSRGTRGAIGQPRDAPSGARADAARADARPTTRPTGWAPRWVSGRCCRDVRAFWERRGWRSPSISSSCAGAAARAARPPAGDRITCSGSSRRRCWPRSRRIPGFSSSSSSAWSRAAGCPIRSCSSSTRAASGRCRRTSTPTRPTRPRAAISRRSGWRSTGRGAPCRCWTRRSCAIRIRSSSCTCRVSRTFWPATTKRPSPRWSRSCIASRTFFMARRTCARPTR